MKSKLLHYITIYSIQTSQVIKNMRATSLSHALFLLVVSVANALQHLLGIDGANRTETDGILGDGVAAGARNLRLRKSQPHITASQCLGQLLVRKGSASAGMEMRGHGPVIMRGKEMIGVQRQDFPQPPLRSVAIFLQKREPLKFVTSYQQSPTINSWTTHPHRRLKHCTGYLWRWRYYRAHSLPKCDRRRLWPSNYQELFSRDSLYLSSNIAYLASRCLGSDSAACDRLSEPQCQWNME